MGEAFENEEGETGQRKLRLARGRRSMQELGAKLDKTTESEYAPPVAPMLTLPPGTTRTYE